MSKNLVTKLTLDKKSFSKDLSGTKKQILALSAASVALGAAVIAAAKHTANFQDETIKAARSVGASVKEYSSLAVAAGFTGVKQEDLNKALRRLAHPVGEAKTALKAYNIETKDAAGNSRKTNEVLKDVANQMKRMKGEAEKVALATQFFGQQGGKLVSMLENGAEGLDAFNEKAILMGKIVTEEAGVAAEKFNDDIADVTGSVNGLVMSIGESVIAFINQSNALDAVEAVIQSVTGFIRDMDADTKEMILTIGAVVVAIGVLGGAFLAVSALAPVIGAAFTVALGPVGIAVMAIGAIVVTLGVTVAKHWGQIENVTDSLALSFGRFKANITETFAPIADMAAKVVVAANGMLGIGDSADKSGQQISIMGTIAKTILAVITTSITWVITGFNLMLIAIRGVTTAIWEAGRAVKLVFTDGFGQATDAALRAKDSISGMISEMKLELMSFGKETKKTFSGENLIVIDKEDIEKAKDAVVDLQGGLDQLEEPTSINLQVDPLIKAVRQVKKEFALLSEEGENTQGSFTALGKAVSSTMAEAAKKIGILVSAVAGLVAVQLAASRLAFEKQSHNLDVITILHSKAVQARIDTTRSAEEERLSILDNSLSEELALVKDIESRKFEALSRAKEQRLLLLDSEYIEARAKKEADFELHLESERERFEAQNEQLDEFNLTNEERRATEIQQEDSWKQHTESLQKQHDANMSEFSRNFQTNKSEEKKQHDDDIRAKQIISNELIASEEERKNQLLESEKARSEAKILAMEKKKTQDEKKETKIRSIMAWQAEKFQVESSKGLKASQVMVSGIAGAAMAFSGLAGSIPIVGIVLGAIAAAVVLASTAMSVSQIQSQVVPPPPSLLLNAGGTLKRNIGGFGPQSGDVINASLTPGESVIDARATKNVNDFMESGMKGGGITVQFEEGSIRVAGDLDEDAIDRIGEILLARVERKL